MAVNTNDKSSEKSRRKFIRGRLREKQGLKKIYLAPNVVTTLNVACGLLSIMFAVEGRFEYASYAIIFGIVFDMLDGSIARMTGTGSTFGINYDSLSDLVTFGVAPGVLTFCAFNHNRPHGKFLYAVVIIYSVCCALRLARFNTHATTGEKTGFKGLPSPAAAGMMAAAYLFLFMGDSFVDMHTRTAAISIQVLALVLAALMVSEVPYPTMGVRRVPFHYFVIALFAVALAIAYIRTETLFTIGVIYVSYGPLTMLFRKLRHSNPDTSTEVDLEKPKTVSGPDE